MNRTTAIRVFLALAPVLLSHSLLAAQTSVDYANENEAEISHVVESLYVRGLQERDFQLIRDACIPEAVLMGVNTAGSLGVTTLEEWSERFDPANPPFRRLDFEIVKIDRVGTAAQVRIDFLIDGERRVTDYLNLLQVQGEWRIVNIIDHG